MYICLLVSRLGDGTQGPCAVHDELLLAELHVSTEQMRGIICAARERGCRRRVKGKKSSCCTAVGKGGENQRIYKRSKARGEHTRDTHRHHAHTKN